MARDGNTEAPFLKYFLVSETFLLCGCAFSDPLNNAHTWLAHCNVILTALTKYEADIIEMGIVFVIMKKINK